MDALISAGLVRIFIGLEAATQNMLDKLYKRLSKKTMSDTLSWLLTKNIDVEISFINFLPFNSIRDIKENVLFFSQWGLDILRSLGNRLKPYPGTFLHDALKREGIYKRDGFFYDYVKNNVDSRVDTLYEIIQPLIPFFSLVSHKLQSVKSLLWREKEIIRDFNFFHEQLLSLQNKIVCEMKDIFLFLTEELEKIQKVDINNFRNVVYQDVIKKSEWWLSILLEIKKHMKKEFIL